MWIIYCTELDNTQPTDVTAHHFVVGPFGTDDLADDATAKLQAEGHVLTDVHPLVEPVRALAGATS